MAGLAIDMQSFDLPSGPPSECYYGAWILKPDGTEAYLGNVTGYNPDAFYGGYAGQLPRRPFLGVRVRGLYSNVTRTGPHEVPFRCRFMPYDPPDPNRAYWPYWSDWSTTDVRVSAASGFVIDTIQFQR
ncbi:MAG: hypothetical protein LBS56_10355 [Propionibacteriaceae bacterium]|jgi:hypothetical protein|nr:hypothetical protein [Propionibacteriaceae bacterium]